MQVVSMMHYGDGLLTVGGSKRRPVIEHIGCAVLVPIVVLTFCDMRLATGSELAPALEIQVDSLHPTKGDRRLETIDVHMLL